MPRLGLPWKEITAEYSAGSSLSKLGKKYGVGKTTIHYHVNRLSGIKRWTPIRKIMRKDAFWLGVFLGLWAGDGTKNKDPNNYNYSVRFSFALTDDRAISLLNRSSSVLFGVKPYVLTYRENQLIYRLISKFVFNLLDENLVTVPPKTLNVSLPRSPSSYSRKFIRGFLTGLALSDGSFKSKRFCFSTISTRLAKQFAESLLLFGFASSVCLQKRKETNWHPIWRVYLSVAETKKFRDFIFRSPF